MSQIYLRYPHGSAERFLIAEQAYQCVAWLKVQGFEVLCIERGPRITIRNSPLCDQLEGVVDGYSRSAGGEQRYRMVTRFDCTVMWAAAPAPVAHPVVSMIKRVLQRIGGAA